MVATKDKLHIPTEDEITKAIVALDVTPPPMVVITSNDEYLSAAAGVRDIAAKERSLEAARLSVTRPLDKLKADAMGYFRPAQQALASRERELRQAIVMWQTKVEGERRAEEARLRDEQRLLEEAARAKALKLASEGKTNQAKAELANIPSVPTVVSASISKAPGIGQRDNWKFEVTDLLELMVFVADNPTSEYIVPNEKLLGEVARATKGKATIPGVRFYAEKGIIVR